MSEKVLVIPSRLLGDFEGIITDHIKCFSMLQRTLYSGEASFIDRDKAEADQNFKQIIPYVVFKREDKVYAYQRTKAAGDSRLHDKWSLGVGGHINAADAEQEEDVGNPENARRAYWLAFERELFEEVQFVSQASKKSSCPITALINDNSNAVGRVHLGVVHIYQVPARTALHSKDPAISKGQWIDISGLAADRGLYENWSQLVIDKVL